MSVNNSTNGIKGTISAKNVSKLRVYSEKVYFELSRIYSSEYSSSDEERESAISVLENHLREAKSSEELELKLKNLYNKMEQLEQKAAMKQKLCTIIKDRYWERTFIPSVKYIPFDINKNL